jgi:hypothetical protein
MGTPELFNYSPAGALAMSIASREADSDFVDGGRPIISEPEIPAGSFPFPDSAGRRIEQASGKHHVSGY